MLMLSAVVSCGPTRLMQPEHNVAEQEAVDLGYGQVSRNNLAFSVSEAKMNEAVENVYMDIFDFLRNNIPGVVCNGIFALQKASIAIVATDNGIEERTAV